MNVLANVNSTITCLSRSLNESYTVPIKLKRRLGYKHQGSILAVFRLSETTTKSYGRVSKITHSSGGRVSFMERKFFLQFLTS